MELVVVEFKETEFMDISEKGQMILNFLLFTTKSLQIIKS